jgi:hypothetical protein
LFWLWIEDISKPLRKVRAFQVGALQSVGMKAIICLPEMQEDKVAVSIWW